MKEEQKRIIRIDDPQECRIIERLNRFVVKVEIKGNYHPAHINNTGRLSELLVTGRQAFCFRTRHQGKTDFRLFAIEESGLGALIDTQLQMKAFEPNKGADAKLLRLRIHLALSYELLVCTTIPTTQVCISLSPTSR